MAKHKKLQIQINTNVEYCKHGNAIDPKSGECIWCIIERKEK